MYCSLSGCFQDFFSLSLVFKSLIMMCLGVDFFGLPCLGLAQLLESVDYYLPPNLGSFKMLFLKKLLKLHLLSPFLLELWWEMTSPGLLIRSQKILSLRTPLPLDEGIPHTVHMLCLQSWGPKLVSFPPPTFRSSLVVSFVISKVCSCA